MTDSEFNSTLGILVVQRLYSGTGKEHSSASILVQLNLETGFSCTPPLIEFGGALRRDPLERLG